VWRVTQPKRRQRRNALARRPNPRHLNIDKHNHHVKQTPRPPCFDLDISTCTARWACRGSFPSAQLTCEPGRFVYKGVNALVSYARNRTQSINDGKGRWILSLVARARPDSIPRMLTALPFVFETFHELSRIQPVAGVRSKQHLHVLHHDWTKFTFFLTKVQSLVGRQNGRRWEREPTG
jgi:hypothetical protein